MARIYQSGDLNTTALVVPDMYVQIVKPQTLLNGVSSGRVGVVGTAPWGPIDTPTVVGGMGDYQAAFGAKQALTTDMGLAVNIAILQGASDFRCVRVTDGTDTAASGTLNGVAITGAHTGSAGNAISVTMAQAANSTTRYTLTVSHATLGGRQYAGTTWDEINTALAADASALIVLTIPSSGTSLAAATVTLSGATDGGTPDATAFLGSDTDGARTGMYALRNAGCALGLLMGLTDTSSWVTQQTFGLGEGLYMVTAGEAGQTIATATAAIGSAGVVGSYALKVLHGDWLWWNDDTYGYMLVPPSAFAVGKLAALSPEQSSLNKSLTGIVGSQKAGLTTSGSLTAYSTSELTALIDAGLDVICYPAPGGSYWACRSGHNCSETSTVWGDNYTRMTNYLAETFATGMGTYIGEPINATLFGNIRSTMLSFLSGMVSQGILALTIDTQSLPYTVVCDSSNNTQARIALGYVQCDVAVQYQGINEKFIVNLQGGTSVTISTGSGSV